MQNVTDDEFYKDVTFDKDLIEFDGKYYDVTKFINWVNMTKQRLDKRFTEEKKQRLDTLLNVANHYVLNNNNYTSEQLKKYLTKNF